MNDRSYSSEEAPFLTLRERKAQETRLLLIDTALELFASKGYDGASIKEIAQKAGVAQGLLYNYFPSKEHLFWAILGQHGFVPRLREVIAAAGDRPAREVLQEAGQSFHEFLADRHPFLRLLLGSAQTNPRVAEVFSRFMQQEGSAFAEYLLARISAGELRPHDPRITIRLLMSAIAFQHVLGVPDAADSRAFIADVVETLLRGISLNRE